MSGICGVDLNRILTRTRAVERVVLDKGVEVACISYADRQLVVLTEAARIHERTIYDSQVVGFTWPYVRRRIRLNENVLSATVGNRDIIEHIARAGRDRTPQVRHTNTACSGGCAGVEPGAALAHLLVVEVPSELSGTAFRDVMST